MSSTPIRHMTTAEVAERLRVTKRTLEDMRKAGKGPKAMILGPRMVRYAEQDVIDYEAACKPARLMKPDEVAKRLNLNLVTLRAMRKTGKGPRFIMASSRSPRYAEADVLAYEQACRQKGGA